MVAPFKIPQMFSQCSRFSFDTACRLLLWQIALATIQLPCAMATHAETASDHEELIEDILRQWNAAAAEQFYGVARNVVVYDKRAGTSEIGPFESIQVTSKQGRLKGFRSSDGDDLSALEQQRWTWTGYNPQYMFKLLPRKNDQFVIDEIHRFDKTSWDDPEDYYAQQGNAINSCIYHWNNVFGGVVHWTTTLDSPGFQLHSVRELKHEGHDAIELRFSFDPDKHGEHDYDFFAGHTYTQLDDARVVLLREYSYAPVSWSLTAWNPAQPDLDKHKSLINVTIEYDLSGLGFPLVKQIHRERKSKQLDRQEETTTRFTSHWTFNKVIGSEYSKFHLADFGIPEPSWYRPPPPYWLYVSLASMALVIVGAVLIRYGKQLWRKG